MDSDQWQRKMDRFGRNMERWGRNWERRHYRYYRPGRHLFTGLVFITLGVVFLLGNMGVLNSGAVLRFWPVILIAAGAYKLVESRDDYAHSSGIFWIVVGGLFLLGSLGILRVAFRDFWPVVLIGLGSLMLWRSALIKREPRNFSAVPDADRSFIGTAQDAASEDSDQWAQVDPHFLFNSLNSINALVMADPAAARRMCVLLADFLRGSLKLGSRERIPLAEEIRLAECYLDIERAGWAPGSRFSVTLIRAVKRVWFHRSFCSRWSRTRSRTVWRRHSMAASSV